MITIASQVKKLESDRKRAAKGIDLGEIIRGTILKRHLTCTRPGCKCHESEKHRHGPYYFLSIRRKNKSQHVYIPRNMLKNIEKWTGNYDKVWTAIEKITDLNARIIQLTRKTNEK